MEISFKSYDKTIVIITKDDVDSEELGNILYNMCLSQGWHKDILKGIFTKEVING